MGFKKRLAPLMTSAQQAYLTPPEYLRDVRALAGGRIALDPSANAENTVSAQRFLTDKSPGGGGFGMWPSRGGLVFSNPTYGRDLPRWAESYEKNFRTGLHDQIVVLVPARTDTKWFRRMASTANAVCFHSGRITFHDPKTGSPVKTWSKTDECWRVTPAPFPSATFYWGTDTDRTLFEVMFSQRGLIWNLGATQIALPIGYGVCPACGMKNPPGTMRDRRPDGCTTCGACGSKTWSRRWRA